MEKEINEVAVEINSIFDNMSIELLNTIPLKIRKFFKNNASNKYIFEYDKTKSLKEQKIKDKTRGIIALLYRDYICNDVERKEFNEIYTAFVNKEEEEKRALFNSNNLFNKKDIKILKNNYNNKENNSLETINENQNFIRKIFNRILKFLKK